MFALDVVVFARIVDKCLRGGSKCHKVSRSGAHPHQSERAFQSGACRAMLQLGVGWCMFVGQHDHALDEKGRVVLPSGYRSQFDDKGYVTQLDNCIGLWTGDGFTKVVARWESALDAQQISLKVFRRLTAGARDVRLDAAGRITLPRDVLTQLGFADEVVLAGRLDRVEIWAAETYQAVMRSPEVSDEVAEAVERLGL